MKLKQGVNKSVKPKAKRKKRVSIVPIRAAFHAPTQTVFLKPDFRAFPDEPLVVPAIPKSLWERFCELFEGT
jgi:hypothetical protein